MLNTQMGKVDRNNSALKMQNVLLNSSKYGRSASNTPPYALHGLLLAICARRAGIPSKTDHRVRKLTYTLQPGGGRPYNRQRKGEEETHILMICKPGEYCGWEGASESKGGRAVTILLFPHQPNPPACRTISSWDEKFNFPSDRDLYQDLR